jgi:cytochrome c oxidase subunit IV
MSSTDQGAVQTEPQDYPHTVAEAEEHEHPSDVTYIYIAIILAVWTALEVSTYFFDFGPSHVPILLGLMVLKFAVVAMYFMHLKFDSKLFRRLFITGLITAIAVYSAALAMFHFWAGD